MKFVEVTAIDLEAEADAYRAARGSQLAIVGEDDLERPAPETTPAEVTLPDSVYFPDMIDATDVREFYPRRKEGRTGTRIVFKNGAARPVKEAYAEMKAKFASLNN